MAGKKREKAKKKKGKKAMIERGNWRSPHWGRKSNAERSVMWFVTYHGHNCMRFRKLYSCVSEYDMYFVEKKLNF